MAGGYQTTGERANVPGFGGWITGRGNQEMTMLKGYAHIRAFFERIPWWELEPHPDLGWESAVCLAEPGTRYVLYLPEGGTTTLALVDGTYRVRRYNPRIGRFHRLPDASGTQWKSPMIRVSDEDWVFLLERR